MELTLFLMIFLLLFLRSFLEYCVVWHTTATTRLFNSILFYFIPSNFDQGEHIQRWFRLFSNLITEVTTKLNEC